MKADVTSNIPQIGSPAEAWIQWHKDLKSYFGKKVANSLWLKAWGIRGSTKVSTVELRKYMKDNGITISETAWQSVVDTGSGALDIAGDMFKVGRYMGIAIGVIIIGGAGLLIYNVVKDPNKSLASISDLKSIKIK
jgi:hypothetical protein